jgi:hypothetical protein
VRYGSLRKVHHQALIARDELEKLVLKINSDPRLSDDAKGQDRRAAAAEFAKRFASLERDLAAEQERLAADRAAIAKPKTVEMSDQMLLAFAGILRGMNAAQRNEVLGPDADPRFLAALFNLPSQITGVPAELTGAIARQRVAPGVLAELDTRSEAVANAVSALEIFSRDMFRNGNVPQHMRDKWMEPARSTTKQALAAERRARDAELANEIQAMARGLDPQIAENAATAIEQAAMNRRADESGLSRPYPEAA